MQSAIRSFVAAVFLALFIPAITVSADPEVHTHIKDYLENNPYGIITARSTPQSSGSTKVRSSVNYTAFNQSMHVLEELEGTFSRILYPATWPAHEKGLTEDQLEEMSDQLDLLWVFYAQMMGQETGGAGKIIVALARWSATARLSTRQYCQPHCKFRQLVQYAG